MSWSVVLRSITMGAGTYWPIVDPGPTADISQTRLTRTPKAAQAGEYATVGYLAAREITVPFAVLGDSAATLESRLATIETIWSPTAADVPLDISYVGSGITRRFYGRPDGATVDVGQFAFNVATGIGRFVALDPIAYGTYRSATIVSGGGASLANSGPAPTPMRFTVTGAATDPQIDCGVDGVLTSTLTLGAGETLMIDGRTRAVLINGLATYSGGYARRKLNDVIPWPLLPGNSSRTIAYAGGGSLLAEWNDGHY